MNFQKKLNSLGAPTTGSATTIIAAGTRCVGEIHSSNDLRIDGTLEADVVCESKLVIGEQGMVTGNVRCKQADIAGALSGNIQAQEQLVLRGNAQVTGNIQTPVLQMEQGVVFNGQCHMGVVEKLSLQPKESVSLAKTAAN